MKVAERESLISQRENQLKEREAALNDLIAKA
jgi:hypothetical protein